MKKIKWWHILGMICEIIGVVFMLLCLLSDINDDIYLPVALFFIGAANLIMLIFNAKNLKRSQKKE